MFEPRKIFDRAIELTARWTRGLVAFVRTRRARKIGVSVVAVVALLGLAGFFGVPLLLHHLLVGQIAKTLKRPVSVGRIGFDLYTLRLDMDHLHIGEPDGAKPFVDVGHIRVRVSWTSVFRFAPVVKEVAITKPSIHIVRTAEQRFNFSDLLENPNPAPEKPKTPAKPMRFAVSNIRILDGEIRFDDQVLGEQHSIEHLNLGVPFIANLPADVDIYVQPLLQMVIDGSPMRIVGKAKPFASPPESVVDLRLHRLELQRYLGYAPKRIAIKIPQGTFSCAVQVRFVNADPASADARPLIRLSGALALDQLDVRDRADAPLLGLRHAVANLSDIEPLGNVISLGKIWVDGLTVHLALNHDGTTNLTSIVGAPPVSAPAAAAAPAAPAAPLTQSAIVAKTENPTDISMEWFELTDSAVKIVDNRNAAPNALSIEDVHLGIQKVRTRGPTPAPFYGSVRLAGGGTIALKGALDLQQSQATTEISVDQLDLPALQGFARPAFAGNIASGKLNAQANVLARFAAAKFDVHVEPANVSIENVKVEDPAHQTPVQWNSLSVAIAQIDLASHQATVNEVRADGLNLSVARGRRGEISLASLMQSPPSPAPKRDDAAKVPKPAATESAPAPAWNYHVASVALEKTALRFEDESTSPPAKLDLAPFTIHLKDISNDLAKPIPLELTGTLNNKGSFNITGTVAPIPLKAELLVVADHLDLAALNPYAAGQLNATIASAALSIKATLGLDNTRKQFRMSYRGDATLADVRVLDKVTGDDFLKWKALNVTRINLDVGGGPPKAHLGAIALDAFYARIILRENGTMNLKEVLANPKSTPTSLTRTSQPPGAAPAETTKPTDTGAPASSADIEIGKIILQRGHVNYSDNFVKPNYTADLTGIRGKIGAFGTHTTQPATVLVDGEVNGSSPIDISGSINPLAPKASLDITAKADGVELTGLTPYSTTYAGYPITKGTLTVNLHYVLDQGKLTAKNHIFIDQLTFGDRVEGTHASNLPLKLAIALLKNSKGQIEVDIPVSGSLSDPQFSVAGAIWGALGNIILKAATSPFSLLGSLIPGGSGVEKLALVEFAPGAATLTPDARKSLATLASVLQQRPALHLDIEGRVDPAFDRAGLREAKLLRSMKELELKNRGGSGDIDEVELTPAESAKYLARVYKAATFTKPKDFLGLDKSIPPEEMKKALLANVDVTDQDLRQLAQARAAVVRKWMAANQVDPQRLFLVAPKLTADGIKDQGKTTRVDLSFE